MKGTDSEEKICEVSENECRSILEQHPEGGLIDHISIEVQKDKAVFYITGKEDSPFKLEPAVAVSQTDSVLAQSSVDQFLRRNLVTDANESLKHDAAGLICDGGYFLHAMYDDLKFPPDLIRPEKFLALPRSRKEIEHVAACLQYEMGYGSVKCTYNGLSVDYDISLKTVVKKADGDILTTLLTAINDEKWPGIYDAKKAGRAFVQSLKDKQVDGSYYIDMMKRPDQCFLHLKAPGREKEFPVSFGLDADRVHDLTEKSREFAEEVLERRKKRYYKRIAVDLYVLL